MWRRPRIVPFLLTKKKFQHLSNLERGGIFNGHSWGLTFFFTCCVLLCYCYLFSVQTKFRLICWTFLGFFFITCQDLIGFLNSFIFMYRSSSTHEFFGFFYDVNNYYVYFYPPLHMFVNRGIRLGFHGEHMLFWWMWYYGVRIIKIVIGQWMRLDKLKFN